MPNDNDLNLDLNTVADLTPLRPQQDAPAEQGGLPETLPQPPHLQTIQPGEHLSAEQIERLMGDEAASREPERPEGTGTHTES